MQQFHFLDVGLDLWQSKVFFALPLLTVVLWLVSNKVEKEQKKSTISLLKVQHLLYIEFDLPNWYSHITKEGESQL